MRQVEGRARHSAHQDQSFHAAPYALMVPLAPIPASCSSIHMSRASVVGGPWRASTTGLRPPRARMDPSFVAVGGSVSDAEVEASLSHADHVTADTTLSHKPRA